MRRPSVWVVFFIASHYKYNLTQRCHLCNIVKRQPFGCLFCLFTFLQRLDRLGQLLNLAATQAVQIDHRLHAAFLH